MRPSLPKSFFPKVTVKAFSLRRVEFPSFSRLITESVASVRATGSFAYVIVLSLVLCLAIGIVLKDIRKNQELLNALQAEKENLLKERVYWEKTVTRYKDYRDGYYQLALLEYQLGNTDAARSYVDKALSIDPQFYQAKYLLQTIER